MLPFSVGALGCGFRTIRVCPPSLPRAPRSTPWRRAFPASNAQSWDRSLTKDERPPKRRPGAFQSITKHCLALSFPVFGFLHGRDTAALMHELEGHLLLASFDLLVTERKRATAVALKGAQ